MNVAELKEIVAFIVIFIRELSPKKISRAKPDVTTKTITRGCVANIVMESENFIVKQSDRILGINLTI